MSKSDLKFYLTSLEANVSQTSPSQSIGGYPSTTEYTVSALLADSMNGDTETMILSSSLSGATSVLTNSELMTVLESEVVDEYGDELLTVARATYGTSPVFHIGGDIAYAQTKNGLLNGSFSASGKQYRCIAIKNTSSTDTFYNVSVYIKSGSKNSDSSVRIAIENPSDHIIYSASSQGTTISLTDSSLANDYPDDAFVGRLLTIDDPDSLNYNTSRTVASFDGRTGTFTFLNSMAFSIEANASYRLDESPSQRITSGRTVPIFGTDTVSDLSTASGKDNAISLDFSSTRHSEDDLLPNEVMYIWFERDISSNADKYENNSIVFTINYRNS